MLDFWSGLFRADFLPHGWCYRWDPGVVLLHVGSDFLIALAYYFIPFALIHIVRKRGDFAYPWMFWLFGTFILACGTTHLMSIFVVWQPWYRLDGLVKLITALASVPTAILLVRISPAIIALPSPDRLRRLNVQLADEVAERKAAEEEVRRLNADLEQRVAERTAELEQANKQLRESEHRLRSILDSSPTLVYLKDVEGRFQFVNRQFERLFGLAREEMIGKTDFDVFPRTAAEMYIHSDNEVLRTGEANEFEELGIVAGHARTFNSIKFPLTEEGSGRVYALCGISSDITDRKNSEEALRRYNNELEQFAYVASHDLQEPLRTVKSYTQLIERRYRDQLDPTGKGFIDFVISGVNRMQTLISGLQSWSQIHRDHENMAEVDTAGALEETLQALASSIEESGATINIDKLPVVQMRRVHLQQVFQNLISNAIKYRSSEPPVIHISARKTSGFCEFVVSDNGIGLQMHYAEQIFGVFQRLHGREVPGAGIGLAICKKTVETYGGRIWVVSEPGKGAAFHFTLPC